MRAAVLFSGGKDSMLSLIKCEKKFEEIILINFVSEGSFLFQEQGQEIVPLLAEAIGKRLVRVFCREGEKEELYGLKKILIDEKVNFLILGVTHSKFQLNKIMSVCKEIGVELVVPLWNEDPLKLLEEVIKNGIESIIVSVSAEGLNEEWIGKKIDGETLEELKKIENKYKININGEGGEYETITLNSSIQKYPIIIDKSRRDWRKDSGILIIEKSYLKRE